MNDKNPGSIAGDNSSSCAKWHPPDEEPHVNFGIQPHAREDRFALR